MIRVKNFVPAISVEGFEAATDGRRGEGTFGKVTHASSCCASTGCHSACRAATRAQCGLDRVRGVLRLDDRSGRAVRVDLHVLPRRVDAPTDLMVTPGQREHLYRFVRKMRQEKPCSRSISKTTASSWAAASPAAATTSTSTLPVTPSPVCLSTTPTLTSTTSLFWKFCTARCSCLPQRSALQQEPSASLPDAGKPRAAGKDGARDRCPQHRPAVSGKR